MTWGEVASMQFATFIRLRIRQVERMKRGGGSGDSLGESLLAAAQMEG